MKLINSIWLVLMLMVAGSSWAVQAPSSPGIAATAHILVDYHSARVLSEENADARVEPASLTKIMTAYVVFQELKEGNIRMDDQVRISEKAWRMQGSRMFIEVDKLVAVEELLKGMIIQSGNDASVALAEHVAGSEEAFAQLMNGHGRRLGLHGTNFTNSTGLPHPDHYTTARDMAMLAGAMVRDFPEYYAWHAIKKYTFNNITQHNRNRLLWRDDSVDGVKTGHTEAAGFCLVASAEREGMRLISAVMGTKSDKERVVESRKLLNYGFRFYETHRLYGLHEPLSQVRIWKGAIESASVGLGEELYVSVPRGKYKQLKPVIHLDAGLQAPIPKGARVGELRLSLAGKELLKRPLIMLQSV
ncbi:MAG: D-alanyl-D-alanine carboxypeptidase, partial [Gammaproteobacteria bacterium]|nr:D-alanyl-D-alanine carboxypeptidase [Gammaproteobacteria bacterium]